MFDTLFVNEKEAYLHGFSLNDDNIDFEEVNPADLQQNFVWHFIRGYFEGNVCCLNCPGNSTSFEYPVFSLSVNKAAYLEKICNFLNLPDIYFFDSNTGTGKFKITGNNALDFLGKLYNNCSVDLCSNFIRNNYWGWCKYGSSVFSNFSHNETFEWCRTREDAISPSKERVSDSGYDLTIIDVVKKFNSKTTLYTTGIKVKPPFGWYIDVVPRSSIIKTGYMLANNVGIIDRAYTGEIMIALIKVDDSAPDLELPCRIAQLIPRRIAHFKFEQVQDIEKTTRNDGGFGSTG